MKSRLFPLWAAPILLFLCACEPFDPKKNYQWETPYPNETMTAIIQETVDVDSTVLYWTEPEDVVQAYINTTPFRGGTLRSDVRLLSRSMMSMTAEVIFKEDNLRLELELRRAFPRKGERSILQVVNVRTEKWPGHSE